ncbi:hypothetical protein JI747_020265 [Chryseobacterium sp. RG1]|uniref:Lipoprotein n=1 Tax=Chryseobacterium tagetis TaxID=2801334 RepID=A0ABS8AA76_9FLAO|nr:hypothetical protein [Chryseobacterium tagetis]MCA6069500.1 hypothetical protein [Chryseobacterium tagetis]
MKNIFFIVILSLLVNCANSVNKSNNVSINGNCIENLDFKEQYFSNIKIIDSLIEKNQNTQFSKSLKFISKYSHVSFESTLNYARLYPIGAYEKDRKGWLEWYEKNKCNNIQFKKK